MAESEVAFKKKTCKHYCDKANMAYMLNAWYGLDMDGKTLAPDDTECVILHVLGFFCCLHLFGTQHAVESRLIFTLSGPSSTHRLQCTRESHQPTPAHPPEAPPLTHSRISPRERYDENGRVDAERIRIKNEKELREKKKKEKAEKKAKKAEKKRKKLEAKMAAAAQEQPTAEQNTGAKVEL